MMYEIPKISSKIYTSNRFSQKEKVMKLIGSFRNYGIYIREE